MSSVAAIVQQRKTKALTDLFDQKNAYTKNSAIEVNDKDFIKYNGVINNLDLNRYKFIKRVIGSNKFYFDKKIYTKTIKVESYFLIFLGIGMFFMLVYLYIKMKSLFNL